MVVPTTTPEPKAFGVDLPTGDEIIGALCPKGHVAMVDRVGTQLYGECRTCSWTGRKTISRERMRSAPDGSTVHGETAR